MKAIEVEGLTKKYKEHLAVDDISFSVDEGAFFAFLGENGAGKSTTINILSTLLSKTAGSVNIFGHELGKEDDAIRNMIGIVFQNSVLDDKLTVKENLHTRGSYFGLNGRQVDERLKDTLGEFEIEDIWNRRYEQLSGGQRRRVDIVKALINEPRILFLDEPTTGLDPKSRKIVWDCIDGLRRKRKMTIFLTTHYMEETKDADKVVILDKGKVIADDLPSALKRRYAKSRLIWYTPRTPEAESILSGTTHIYDSDHYNITFEDNITDFLYRHSDKITDYEVIKGSMDDVFLNLTGRGMDAV